MLSEYGRVFGEADCGDLSTGHGKIFGGCFSWGSYDGGMAGWDLVRARWKALTSIPLTRDF